MNVNAIASRSAATETQDATAAAASKSSQAIRQDGATTPSSTTVPAKTDTVTISAAGKAALAEATETAAQTAKEAQNGDRQAMKLVAKQAQNHAQH
ncbi:hypothetical protein [Herbaspirillum chlorophenolicum]|jgi:hypothetical protein|uniref:hypothetical protein n=1 Tax=Herbaspirillum chlorophenolicum TaxID=211589 RepID=UPI00077321BB|nr:hypothetical protein [Herbaspirillum chlorophenolicum]